MKRVTITWTEVNHHSAEIEVPDDLDVSDRETWDGILDQALDLTGTYDGTSERTIDDVEQAP